MAHNLRRTQVDGDTYVNVTDLLKMIYEIVQMDGLHPEAAKALGGFSTGLALSLEIVSLSDLPDQLVAELNSGEKNGR